MTKEKRNISTIISIGMRAISEKLDPIETALFFQHYNLGSGDYVKEREEIFKDVTLEEVVTEIKKARKNEN
jgi:hypothetical protein